MASDKSTKPPENVSSAASRLGADYLGPWATDQQVAEAKIDYYTRLNSDLSPDEVITKDRLLRDPNVQDFLKWRLQGKMLEHEQNSIPARMGDQGLSEGLERVRLQAEEQAKLEQAVREQYIRQQQQAAIREALNIQAKLLGPNLGMPYLPVQSSGPGPVPTLPPGVTLPPVTEPVAPEQLAPQDRWDFFEAIEYGKSLELMREQTGSGDEG